MIEIKVTIEAKITEKTPTIPIIKFQPNRLGDLETARMRQWFEENFASIWREVQKRK